MPALPGQYLGTGRRPLPSVAPRPAARRGAEVRLGGDRRWMTVQKASRSSVTVEDRGEQRTVPRDRVATSREAAPPPPKPTAVQIGAPVAERLRGFAARAKTEGPVDGMRYASQVIERGLVELLDQMRGELEVGEVWPTPAKSRAPRRSYGGVLSADSDLEQITLKADPALMDQARAALWYLSDHSVPADRAHGVATLQELVTAAAARVLDRVGG